MLLAFAGSMITVAGLIFLPTRATLAQVARQYTSHLLRDFMRDRTNRVVMGFFVYCQLQAELVAATPFSY